MYILPDIISHMDGESSHGRCHCVAPRRGWQVRRRSHAIYSHSIFGHAFWTPNWIKSLLALFLCAHCSCQLIDIVIMLSCRAAFVRAFILSLLHYLHGERVVLKRRYRTTNTNTNTTIKYYNTIILLYFKDLRLPYDHQVDLARRRRAHTLLPSCLFASPCRVVASATDN